MGRILVVEDDEELRRGLEAALARHGELLTAADVPAALATLECMDFDLILLDMILPKGTGFQVLEYLRGRTGAVPAVIVTSALAADLDLAPYSGLVAAVLPKPFSLQKLKESVTAVLSGRPPAQAEPALQSVAEFVLLVDDDRELREGMADYLRRAGYRVTTAADTVEAMAQLAQSRFDVVVSDWIMPGTSGTTLLEWIRTSAPHLPVLMLTGHGTPDFTRRALSAGAVEVLLKPFPPKALLAAVEKCIRQARPPEPLAKAEPPAGPGESATHHPERLDLAGQERTAIIRALEKAGGNKVQAAKLLGISRAGLYIKLKVYDLN